jgi:N6-L-threonylcarbamoyladenine synthase
MITLGIETSCDETSVAVVKDGRQILSNIVVSSVDEHKEFGGVVPEIASRSHVEAMLGCLDRGLKRANVTLKDIDLVAMTRGPGLMSSLLVGLSAGKAIALSLGKPIVGVDHVIAHVYAGFLTEPGLSFPLLGLVVSGGHTLILRMNGPDAVRVLGRTLDDAAGEAFDKVAKMMRLGYPGGPEIDRLARGEDPNRIHFTRPFLSNDSFDFSFSGIKTAVFYKIERFKRNKPLTMSAKRAIASGFQEAVCDVLVKKSLRAARSEGLATIVVGGGVSANRRLREKFRSAAMKDNIKVVFPDARLCRDNAAMIAGLGAAIYAEGRRESLAIGCYSDFLHAYRHGN